MPGPVLHFGATVICTHGGTATPTAPVPRVLVSGQPVATIGPPYAILGCPLVPPPMPPCLTGQWTTGAVRVLAGGAPVAIQGGSAVTVPNGTPMIALVVQPRVVAT